MYQTVVLAPPARLRLAAHCASGWVEGFVRRHSDQPVKKNVVTVPRFAGSLKWCAAAMLISMVPLQAIAEEAVVLASSPDGSVIAQVQSMDRFQAEQERLKQLQAAKPKAYEDKFMDSSSLPAMSEGDGQANADVTGMRGFVLETRYDMAHSDSGLTLKGTGELGQRAEYRQETLNYGDFVGQLDLRTRHGDSDIGFGPLGYAAKKSSDRITLRNLGFPITPKLFADTSIGDISSEVTDALTRAYRLSLGSSTVRGIGTRIFDGQSDLRAGFGERGTLAGGPFPGFERGQGSLAWAGYSRRLPGNVSAGLQINRAQSMPIYSLFSPRQGETDDVTSVATSVGYGGDLYASGDYKARLMHVQSQTSAAVPGLAKRAQGVFLEGGLRASRYRHEFGTYRADQNLRFGDYLLPSDNRGAYWRMDTSGLRQSWGLGIDIEDQNPHRDPTRLSSRRTGLSGNVQYRLNRDDSLGANVNLGLTRYINGNSLFTGMGDGTRSLYASAYYQARFAAMGRSRLRLTLQRNEVLVLNDIPATGEQIEWEQDWITGKYETMRPELVTTLGLARDRSNGISEITPTAGVSFRVWPDADWNVGGSMRYTSRSGNLATSRGLSGTLDTEKVLGSGWRLGASLSLNQAVVNVAAQSMTGPQISRSNEKYASIYLRWEGSSGTSFQSAGLRNAGSAGGGGVDGIVFFDINRDGEQQTGENGVPNVEVILDGRYRTTTDRTGRFDFPLVATGPHQLTLRLETVPLPWGSTQDRGFSVNVPLRGQTSARIPVVRVGD